MNTIIKLWIILFLFIPTVSANAQVKSYELAGGEVHAAVIKKGQYLPVIEEKDTLLLWVQSVSENREPDREKARAADVVVWCYPEKYPDERHPMPDANIISVLQHKNRIIFARKRDLPSSIRYKIIELH